MDSRTLLIDAIGHALKAGHSPDPITQAFGQGDVAKANALLVWSIVEGVAGAASDAMRRGYAPDAIADNLESGAWCALDTETDRTVIRGICALLRVDPLPVVRWTD